MATTVAGPQEGTMKVSVIEAKLERDTEWVGKMDPYCKLDTVDQHVRTRTLDGAGKNPVWNQAFNVDVPRLSDVLKITVMDEDDAANAKNDDEVGQALIKFSVFAKTEGEKDDWYPIFFEKKEAGKIHLKTTWIPKEEEKSAGAVSTPTENTPKQEEKPAEEAAPEKTEDAKVEVAVEEAAPEEKKSDEPSMAEQVAKQALGNY